MLRAARHFWRAARGAGVFPVGSLAQVKTQLEAGWKRRSSMGGQNGPPETDAGQTSLTYARSCWPLPGRLGKRPAAPCPAGQRHPAGGTGRIRSAARSPPDLPQRYIALSARRWSWYSPAPPPTIRMLQMLGFNQIDHKHTGQAAAARFRAGRLMSGANLRGSPARHPWPGRRKSRFRNWPGRSSTAD